MKGFLAKAKKTLNVAANLSTPVSDHVHTSKPPVPQAHTGLKPKYTVPPVPHPCPHQHIAIIASQDGLLLRAHIQGSKPPTSFLRIAWGKAVIIEEIDDPGGSEDVDWMDSVIIYGIIGILELFSVSYLLVIASRIEVGHVFDEDHAVYGISGVVAVPLSMEGAKLVLNTLASRNVATSRRSLLPSATPDSYLTISSATSSNIDYEDSHSSQAIASRVQFTSEDQIKIMSPVTIHGFDFLGYEGYPRPASPSAASTTSSESATTSPVAKVLADRLSFWTRLSKRTPSLPQQVSNSDPMHVESSLNASEYMDPLTCQPEALDRIIRDGNEEPSEVLSSIVTAIAPPPTSPEEKHSELESKILRECIREYTKGGMYFAYNFDITHSLQHKQELIAKSQKQHALLVDLNAVSQHSLQQHNEANEVDPLAEPYPTLPLWRRADKQFWWNEWLAKPFIDAGLHSYVLPIMQGYYQVASFPVPVEDLGSEGETNIHIDYVIVSRRSKDRAGLRYQRRGIDDEAHVANFVETETVMHVEREGRTNIFSYVQIRGSIPLYWTQSGYSLKPPPVLATDRTHSQHLDVLRRHFQRTVPQYGPHTIVNLAEQQGKEAAITRSYREYVAELNWSDARYNEYDFHHETKGMKYENISRLIEAMERTFEQQGYLWISDNAILSRQRGVFRVNCIDCLDRTNVVQSAFARFVMNKQLSAVALPSPSAEGRVEVDLVFNDVWANNGDAISRAYAGTSALKGDFTRTGRRDLSGMLNDGVNSLARMYTSTFSDWFSQAVIDFMLGNRTLSVFSEFLLKLQSTDPRDLIRLSKIRAEAIATSVSRVLEEGERLLSGWTLFAPEEFNVQIGDKFEEKVLLLTVRALYIISYDYTLEKVKLYTRIPLVDIISISKGAYILSPLEEASRDALQNSGFVITWANTAKQTTRVTSYSIRNSLDAATSTSPRTPTANFRATITSTTRKGFSNLSRAGSRRLSTLLSNASLASSAARTFAAFKVLPIDPARIRRSTSSGSGYAETADELAGAANCREGADRIVGSIWRACEDAGGGRGEFVREEDVVSLAEAQRMTSMYAKMEYGIKRLLWLGG